MSNTKHTPGPWAVKAEIDGTSRLTRVVAGGVVVARTQALWGRPHAVEVEANARLISAAPDLLAACQSVADEIENTFDQHDLVNGGETLLGGFRDTLRVAIAKATNAQPLTA